MTNPRSNEDRVLILAPTGRDAELIANLLGREGTTCLQCRTPDELADALEEGAAAALFAEEALIGVPLGRLFDVLGRQPSWSDFPLLFLTSAGQEPSETSTRLLAMFGEEANITILERPAQSQTLLSSVRSALRARRRQYEVRDHIEERAQKDAKLMQKQKLESLGILAGGVAHDFNNLLTGILGNASLALETIPEGSPTAAMLQDVIEASERAAHLTKQMLAYAGKGQFMIEPVGLSELVRDISHLIKSSIPKNAQVHLNLADQLPHVLADSSQLQQLIMNLVINGAEAIPEGKTGTVTVTTRLQQVDESYLVQLSASEELDLGAYVLLEVQDTGVGMNDETLRRIFDPFFTTKFAGRGLGLAATEGIVRGHKGLLRVFTAPGSGSTFKVLLPVTSNEAAATVAREPASVKPGTRSGTVLVIDDEEVVRRTARAGLERSGYDVIVAEDGAEGIRLFESMKDKVAVVLLDLTMPGIGGEEVLRRIQSLSGRACVILSSGYNEFDVIQHFAGRGLAGFLQKPYTSAALVDKVNGVLSADTSRG